MAQPERQAGAKIEITDEMIKAGQAVIWEHGAESLSPLPAFALAEEVYIAMRRLEPEPLGRAQPGERAARHSASQDAG